MGAGRFDYFRNAKFSADCLYCNSAPRERWCEACKRSAAWLERVVKPELALVMVIDATSRKVRFEKAEPMRDASNEAKGKSFPETLVIAEGEKFVLFGKEVRPNIKTKYGDRTVIECTERVTKKTVSVWWPKGLPLPSLKFPFILNRTSKNDYRVVECDTREEALELWQSGEVKNPVMNAGDSSADFK